MSAGGVVVDGGGGGAAGNGAGDGRRGFRGRSWQLGGGINGIVKGRGGGCGEDECVVAAVEGSTAQRASTWKESGGEGHEMMMDVEVVWGHGFVGERRGENGGG
ncbi:hypothetical protein Tco_0668760 [Tanacetum coccineum]